MTRYRDIFAALAAPFASGELKERDQSGRKLTYITSRTAMIRLDEVLGPENWEEDTHPVMDGTGAYRCRLTITLPEGEKVTKTGIGGAGSDKAKVHPAKSAAADAFKRAAVQFGVARYLYRDGVARFGSAKAPAPARATIAPPPAPIAAGPELVAEYREWLVTFVDGINAKWRDRLPDRGDLINRWRLSRHLAKWGRVSGRIESPADSSAAEADRIVATMFDRDPSAVEAEARTYCRELWSETRAKSQAGEVAPEDATQEVAEADEPFDETETRTTEEARAN